METLLKALIVKSSHLLARILLHLNFVFELGGVEQERVNLVLVLHQNFSFQLSPEFMLLILEF